MRPLPDAFTAYGWALSTAEAARIAGLATHEVLRFDGNTPPQPPAYASERTIADALAEIQRYPHGGFPALLSAIAEYAGVEQEQVVLGAGADDLLLLCGRAFAGPGDVVRVVDEPTYPVLRMAAWLAGADVGDDDPVLTFCCRPHNPTGALVSIPDARPLVVDEAYFEFAGDTALGRDGVVVIRTFSKAFGLAAARVGLRRRRRRHGAGAARAPGPAADHDAVRRARARRAARRPARRRADDRRARVARRAAARARARAAPVARELPLRADAGAHARSYDRLLRRGLVVRPSDDAIRITVHTREANERLLAALE